MPENSTNHLVTNWDLLVWGLGIAVTALMAMLGIMGKDYRARLVKVEEEVDKKTDNETFNNTADSMRKELNKCVDGINHRLDNQSDKIDKLYVTLLEIVKGWNNG